MNANMTYGGMNQSGDRRLGFFDSISLFFENYFNFSGRSSRGAFWWFILAVVIIETCLISLDSNFFPHQMVNEDSGPIIVIWSLLTMIPTISLSVRRLHDMGRSGWWLLLVFTGIGVILLVWWVRTAGNRYENKYGFDREAGRP